MWHSHVRPNRKRADSKHFRIGRTCKNSLRSLEAWAIKGAPEDPGLFALYCRGELICVGVAKGTSTQDTIRARLTALFEDPANVEIITHYQWEIDSKPDLKRELYLKQLRRVPADCNQLPSA
jgi:hypothetical protein